MIVSFYLNQSLSIMRLKRGKNMINNDEHLINHHKQSYSPLVTPEKYAELSGLSLNAVKSAIQEGRLPVIHRANGRRGRSYINMKSIEEFAKEQAANHQHWKELI